MIARNIITTKYFFVEFKLIMKHSQVIRCDDTIFYYAYNFGSGGNGYMRSLLLLGQQTKNILSCRYADNHDITITPRQYHEALQEMIEK